MSHSIDYRPYQIEGRDAAFAEFAGGTDATCVVLPTGCGKTVMSGMCFEEALKRGRRGLFLAHREVLITQAFDTLTAFGFDCAIEMAGMDARANIDMTGLPQVTVASVQSLQGARLGRWERDAFGFIVTDECHRALADGHQSVFNHFCDYWHLGITATPDRGDDRNIGALYKTKAYEYSMRRAIREGWLAPVRTRECRVQVDLRGVKLHGGDFSLGELVERVTPMMEQLCRAFVREIGGRPAVFFTPDVGTANLAAQIFAKLGHPSEYVAGVGGEWGMSKAEKNEKLGRFNDGEFQIITCCDLLFEGWDCPKVAAVGIGRATRKRYRYTQMVGRGTRPSPDTGKEDCLVVDFDWQTEAGAKDICASVDLFDDGSLDADVRDEAARIERDRKGQTLDPEELIAEAEGIVKIRRTLHIHLTGKAAQYETVSYDPVGVAKILDINLNRKYDLDRQGRNPASDKQLGMLKHLGVDAPAGLSRWGASKLIDKLVKRRDMGFASPKQVRTLLAGGINEEVARSLTVGQANDYISALDGLEPAKVQGSLF
jgi:superfamily II DNA or RNA helicase